MSLHLEAKLGRAVCRDRESESPYDSFALSGAVVVDGKPYAFAKDPVSANETISIVFGDDLLWQGTSGSNTVGLVLRGYDIDDNDKWRQHREEIGKYNDLLAKAIAALPGGGTVVAGVLKVWPDVVDQFVDWDQNDLLMSAAFDVELPPPSQFAGAPPVWHAVSHRESGSSLVSSWDYEVFVHFRYTSGETVPFPSGTPKVTYRPFHQSTLDDWIGTWDATVKTVEPTAPPVTCTIRRSAIGSTLDVSVTERRGVAQTYEYSDLTPPDHGIGEVGKGDIESANTTAHVAAVETSGRSGVSRFGTDLAGRRAVRETPSTDPRWARRFEDAQRDPSPFVEPSSRWKSDVSEATDELPFETDVLRLGPDAALAMYEIVQDDDSPIGKALMYLRPVLSGSRVSVNPVAELLHRVI